MAEADELCERIAIVDHGRILAIGSPDELKQRVQRESIFRLELDRLDGGAAALARLPGVVSAAPAAEADAARRAPDRQPQPRPRGRRRARRRRRRARRASARTSWRCASRSRPSRTSSSSSSAAASTTTSPARRQRPASRRRCRHAGADPGPARARGRRAGRERGRLTMSRLRVPPDRNPAEAADWTPRQALAHRPARGRRPRLSARHRDVPREVVALLRDPPAVPRDVGLRLRLPRRSRRRRSTSASSSSAGR